MDTNKTIREPQQSRSIQTKEKILDAAYRLFCEKGYYKTTTNEIARVANVSIGSLYSYFRDKDTVLLEIMDQYTGSFMSVHERMISEVAFYRDDPKTWLRRFVEGMIEARQVSKELNRELQVLRHSKPEVATVLDKDRASIQQHTLEYIVSNRDILRVQDLEAAALVVYHIINMVVDQIVFCENAIDDQRILSAGVDAVYQYLIG